MSSRKLSRACGIIRKLRQAVCIGIIFMGGAPLLSAQDLSGTLVFAEPGFPSADSASPTASQLEKLVPGAKIVSARDLASLPKFPATRLLVLPYGSAFPEEAWPSIFEYLRSGGNLLVLGGRPFTRAAYREADGWRLRDYSVRFTRALQIDQYQETPGSEGLEFQTNSDMVVQLPRFSWKRGFSPIIRLSAVDLYKRGGSAGSIDARLDAFAWGVHEGRKLAAPAMQIDHLRNGFNGGRWVFLSAELPDDFASPQSPKVIAALAEAAIHGSQEFIVRPVLPLYLPNEPVEVRIDWQSATQASKSLTARIAVYPEAKPSARSVHQVQVPAPQAVVLPPPAEKGLHFIDAELLSDEKVIARYRSGFWIRDNAYLHSGPKVTVNRDYFELDGRPLAVVGTTYMSSEVQRLYFEHPNVYVWNRDLAEISQAGLNMIRTGWWTGWEKFCDQNGQPYERTLRTLEAYLMTARKHGLPVQFNFFAFLPEVLGGANPYLDPEAVRKQRTLISAVVARFRDVPFLVWDLINEPSISQYLWRTRPNGDEIELARWNQWLIRRYPNRAQLAAAWNLPAAAAADALSLPEEIEFAPRGTYVGRNSLKLYDYYLFAQETFAEWTQIMRDAIRATGSQQLVTVGQDEGGIRDRLSPAFWGPLVSFSTNHSWWENDSLLWDSVFAKQPGLPLLIQETGLQRELNLDETSRRTPESEAALLERKVALAFVQSGGTIQWLWHSNAYMTEGNETPIGAVRSDGTEKPEATTMRQMAAFAKTLGGHLREPKFPEIAIVTSQAAQYSVLGDLQVEAQRKAVRALAYNARLTAYAVAENQIEKLGTPKLAILPSPQALSDSAWRRLLKYVNDGGNLLVTGAVERDEHWQRTARASEMKLSAQPEPLTHRHAEIILGKQNLPISFDQQKQNWLEWLRFADNSGFKEISYGRGRIFWAANPVELAEGLEPATEIYRYVAGRVGVTPAFELKAPLAPGVLVYSTELKDSVFYIMVSDSADGAAIDLRDKATGARLTLKLPAQRAAMAVIGRDKKQVIVKYGF